MLAINTNKSIYKSVDLAGQQEVAYLQMGVLDDSGHTVCDADLKLEIKEPSGTIVEFSGALGTIIKSPTCGADNVTDDPDYFSHYTLGGTGTYALKLTNLKNKYSVKVVSMHTVKPIDDVLIKNLSRKMSKNGMQTSGKFSWDETARKVEAVYERCLGE